METVDHVVGQIGNADLVAVQRRQHQRADERVGDLLRIDSGRQPPLGCAELEDRPLIVRGPARVTLIQVTPADDVIGDDIVSIS